LTKRVLRDSLFFFTGKHKDSIIIIVADTNTTRVCNRSSWSKTYTLYKRTSRLSGTTDENGRKYLYKERSGVNTDTVDRKLSGTLIGRGGGSEFGASSV